MASLNKVMLIGNLVRDPELRTLPTGSRVCDFSIAVNRVYSSDSGEKREETTFVECFCWGKTADTIANYFNKGKSIYVEGRLQLDVWDDKQTGQKRSKMRVCCEEFQFMPDGKKPQAQSELIPSAESGDDCPDV